MTPASLEIGAVVIAYRDDAYRRVVEDLLAQGMDPAAIVVVRNPHPDDRGPLDPPGGARVIEMPVNRVYAPAMNAGIEHHRQAGRDWVFLLTSDVHLRPGALDAMRRAAAQADAFGALAPGLWTPDGAPYSFGSAPGDDVDISHRTVPPAPTGPGQIAAAGYVDGATILARMAAIDAVGGFDPKWFMYYEETDWLLRARRGGYEVGVVLDAQAEQAPGGSSRPGVMAFTFMRNGLEFGRIAGGSRGVWRMFRLQALRARGSLMQLLRGPDRRAGGAALVAAGLGLGAFVLRRFGPTPRWLPGQGDLER